MAARVFTEIKSFVTEHKADLVNEGFIERYELLHAQDGGGHERLLLLRDLDAKDPETITETLYKQASNDCDSRIVGTPQRYIIHGYRHADEPDFKYAFILNAKVNLTVSGDTEPATSTGLLGQMMRQVERQHNQIMGFSDGIAGRLGRDLIEERAHRQRLESNALAVNERLSELNDRHFEREEARASRLAKEARQEALMAMVMNVAPMLFGQIVKALNPGAANAPQVTPASLGPAARVASPAAAPETAPVVGDETAADTGTAPARDGVLSEREKLVAEFLGSLSTEEVTATIQAVGPTKSVQLYDIFKSYSEVK